MPNKIKTVLYGRRADGQFQIITKAQLDLFEHRFQRVFLEKLI